MLKEQIGNDLITAMKSGETEVRDTLRMLDSMIKNEEIAHGKREEGLDDDAIIVLVKRAIKQRTDSATQYRDGGRDELAQKEESEIRILKKYLPAQMDEEALRSVAQRIITETEAHTVADMGKVMGVLMQEVGAQTDGTTARRIVEDLLKA